MSYTVNSYVTAIGIGSWVATALNEPTGAGRLIWSIRALESVVNDRVVIPSVFLSKMSVQLNVQQFYARAAAVHSAWVMVNFILCLPEADVMLEL